MPKYYCDYCEVTLSHNSASVRKVPSPRTLLYCVSKTGLNNKKKKKKKKTEPQRGLETQDKRPQLLFRLGDAKLWHHDPL